MTAGTGTGETQIVTGDAVSITNSGNAHALTLTGTGNTILIDGTESVSITANSQYAPISNFAENPWSVDASTLSSGGTIDIESAGTIALSNTAGGKNQVIDVRNADGAEALKLTVNGDKTAAQVTVNANNAELNGGYYANGGGKVTVTLTGNSVQTAPKTASGLSSAYDSLPSHPVSMVCGSNGCSITIPISGIVGFITGKNMAGGAISGSSFTETTEAGTVVNGNLVAEDNSEMKRTIGGTLNGYADAWYGFTADITVTGDWTGDSTAYYTGTNTIDLTGTWTGDADAYLGGTLTAAIAEGAVWTGDAVSEGDEEDGYGLLTANISGTWNGNAESNYGAVLNANIKDTGVWTGDAESIDSYDDKASEVHVDNAGTWNGNVSATKGSAVALNIKGTWNGAVVEASEDSTVNVTDNTSSSTESVTQTTESTADSTSTTHGVLRFARLLAVNTASNDLTDTSDTTEATGTDDAADAEEDSTPAPGVSVNFEGDNVSWNLTGDSELSGLNIGDGTISFPTPAAGESFTGTTLTVNGDYTANNATLNMTASLSGANSASDLLAVTGAATGATTINVTPVMSTGEPKADGVELVSVVGYSSNATFTMPGTLKSGAYIYSLKKADRLVPHEHRGDA